jgi:hypothetical protein
MIRLEARVTMACMKKICLAMGVAASLFASVAHGEEPAANPGAALLSNERWIDRTYGLSLLPPAGTRTVTQTVDDYVMRMADDQGVYTMSLSVHHSKKALAFEKVVDAAKEQLGWAQPTVAPIAERPFKVQGRPAHLLYVQLPQVKGKDLLMAQLLVEVNPETFAVLEMQAEMAKKVVVTPIFEAVAASVEIADPKELNKQREQAIDAGQAWHDKLTLKQIHGALIPDQLFRMYDTQKNQDMGYMRVRQSVAAKGQQPGVVVEVQWRSVIGPVFFDTLAEYFLSDDNNSELWSITTTQRPAAEATTRPVGKPGKNPADTKANPTFVETGIRVGDEITVTVDEPPGPRQPSKPMKKTFQRPKTIIVERVKGGKLVPETIAVAYLSQVESLLLPQLLPLDVPNTYGFYCYHSRRGLVTLRTDQVTPTLKGIAIETRLTTNEAALRLLVDGQHHVLEKQLSPQIKLVPTSAAELQKLWPNQ